MANLMLTMLLGGLWHGAGWNFVIWGGLNGAYLALENLTGCPRKFSGWWGSAAGRLWVIGGYFFSLIFFRASTFEDARTVIANISQLRMAMLAPWWESLHYFNQWQVLLLLALAISTHVVHAFGKLRLVFQACPLELRSLFYVVLGFTLLHFYPSGKVSAFIYFQF